MRIPVISDSFAANAKDGLRSPVSIIERADETTPTIAAKASWLTTSPARSANAPVLFRQSRIGCAMPAQSHKVTLTASDFFHPDAMEPKIAVGEDRGMTTKPTKRRTFIREWRQARGLTIEQLAARLDDMAPSNLSMLERGQRGYVQDTLERIAQELQTDVAALLTRKPTEDEPISQIWNEASPAQRRQIVAIAKTITGAGE